MNNENEGFSVLEVLVAFTILSAAIALSMTSYSQGLGNLRTAALRLDAMSVLDSFDFASSQSTIADTQGRDDFRVETTIEPIAETPFYDTQPKLVTLRVFAKNSKQILLLEVNTILISPAKQ
jgi:type II secretory pathway pseudopilin PulG